jgi:dolichyl-phosphate-mannose--protein O-mannosyl transferase
LAVSFFALGFSTKWIALFGFAGQLAILLGLRLKPKLKGGWLCVKVDTLFDHPFFHLCMFVEFAMLVYFLTYIPNMLAGSTLTNVFQLQGYMFAYHSELNAGHPFASSWWTWPLILRPLWLFGSYLPGDVVSTIVCMGNPAVWWVGFMFVILAVKRAIRRKDFGCVFITVLFLFQWMLYILVSRPTFIYHFYGSVPFLCLASARFLDGCWSRKWGKAAALTYFVGVIVLFWLFYPAISGTPAPTIQIDSLKWLGSWVF